MTVKQRLIEFIKFMNISQSGFEKAVGLSNGYVNNIKKSVSDEYLQKITLKYPALNPVWLRMGVGNMLMNVNDHSIMSGNELNSYIRLLPISAIGGSLNDFTMSIKDSDCEKITSPIKDVDFAITVTGHSMFPEYPAGSQVLIKKIDEKQFIEWGRAYILDTCNGVVLKKLVKGEPGFYHCVSVNPDQDKYAPFSIPEDAVFGVYRVLMIMSMK